MEKEKEFYEFGCGPEEKAYRVTRSFFLNTRLGPPVSIPKGALVHLSVQTGTEAFFSNMVEPVDLSKTFEVVHPFRTVQDGEYLDLDRGDLISLSREEGLVLMRELKVREVSNET